VQKTKTGDIAETDFELSQKISQQVTFLHLAFEMGEGRDGGQIRKLNIFEFLI